MSVMRQSRLLTANHALQRTAAGHRGCKRRVSWPPSLSLDRLGVQRYERARSTSIDVRIHRHDAFGRPSFYARDDRCCLRSSCCGLWCGFGSARTPASLDWLDFCSPRSRACDLVRHRVSVGIPFSGEVQQQKSRASREEGQNQTPNHALQPL